MRSSDAYAATDVRPDSVLLAPLQQGWSAYHFRKVARDKATTLHHAQTGACQQSRAGCYRIVTCSVFEGLRSEVRHWRGVTSIGRVFEAGALSDCKARSIRPCPLGRSRDTSQREVRIYLLRRSSLMRYTRDPTNPV